MGLAGVNQRFQPVSVDFQRCVFLYMLSSGVICVINRVCLTLTVYSILLTKADSVESRSALSAAVHHRADGD